MGAYGSSHMKVLGQCYDLKDDKQYYGDSYNFGPFIFGCIFLIASVVLLVSNFATSFNNRFLIGFMILSFLCSLYSLFLHHSLSKWWFAKSNGTKVDCPKPKSECDNTADSYVKGTIQGPYTCDERFKYK